MNERTEASLTTISPGVWDEGVISTHPWLISSIVNVFDWPSELAVGLAGSAYKEASVAARLNLPRKRGTGVGPRENGDLIRPTKASPWDT